MMDAKSEEELAAKRARDALERLLRPRGELVAEKRAMIQGLAHNLGQEQLSSPIYLIDPDKPISLLDTAQEKQREFIEAVQKNIKLQKELSKLRAEHGAAVSAATSAPSSSTRADAERELLQEQLECNRLGKERQRLEALNRCYEELNRQPAAAPDFLNPKVMFQDCAPFPELPKELVEGFTKDQEAPDQEAQELVSRLRKATMRQKLVLEHDQRKLEALKEKHPINPKDLPPEAQLVALNAVKNSLVNWIETMLSKAGEGESEDASTSPSKTQNKDFDRDTQLAEIEKEYKRHIELRKEIMASMSQLHRFKESPRPQQGVPESAPVEPLPAVPEPQTYLLTPYLEKLQALSQEQKGLVQEKAHINATIARQQKEANKTLRRLAQDSKLLSKHATPKSDKPQASLSFAKATKSATITEQVQPWLFAADSAKIATLEAVAEAVDQGQVSIEDAMQALEQVSILQNKGPLQHPGDGEPQSAERSVGSADEEEKSGISVERRAENKPKKDEPKSIWSILDGNLGLINE